MRPNGEFHAFFEKSVDKKFTRVKMKIEKFVRYCIEGRAPDSQPLRFRLSMATT
jgi:hypothetical protein